MTKNRRRAAFHSHRGTRRGTDRRDRETGSQLLELLMAVTILTVGALGFLFATQSSLKASRDVGTNDLVAAAFHNAVRAVRGADFETLYSTYNNTTLSAVTTSYSSTQSGIGELVDGSGNPATVLVTFHINETNLPAAYGPVADLDGDGAMTTTDISGGYDLLPTRLSLTFRSSAGMETRELFLLLAAD